VDEAWITVPVTPNTLRGHFTLVKLNMLWALFTWQPKRPGEYQTLAMVWELRWCNVPRSIQSEHRSERSKQIARQQPGSASQSSGSLKVQRRVSAYARWTTKNVSPNFSLHRFCQIL